MTKLDPGTYEIEVTDLSEEHNFRLTGPGVNRATEVEGTGTETWTVALTDGTYPYQCDPHAATMSGSFRVGNARRRRPRRLQCTPVTADSKLRLTSGPRLHDHAENRGGQGRQVDAEGHVHRRRPRPVAHPQRACRRAGLQPRDEAARLHGLADLEGEARSDGTLRFLCDPHSATMKGSAKIVR